MTLPYENSTSGRLAIEEMRKILQRFGCSSFGIMDDFSAGEVIAQFEHRGRKIILRVSTKGYAAAWLRQHPYTHRTRSSKAEHEKKALTIASMAVYSILRDWIKAQITAVEIGMLSFEGAFLGQIMLPSGQTVLDVVGEKMLGLSAPEVGK